MSKSVLPHDVEPERLADRGASLTGVFALAKMDRLLNLLGSERGEVQFELQFGVDSQRLRYIQGHLTTRLSLICQRCMLEYVYPLEIDFLLSPVTSDKAAEKLPSHYEALVTNGKPVQLVTLIEDEILLNLPIVAKHDEPECSVKILP